MECLEFIKESLHITNGEIKRRDGSNSRSASHPAPVADNKD